MKTQLTAEQSANLISKGVSAEKASKWIVRQVADSLGRPLEKTRIKRWRYCKPYEKSEGRLTIGLTRFEHKDIFTLADLIALLPKDITAANGEEYYFICGASYPNGDWGAAYSPKWFDGDNIGSKAAIELIDALYLLLSWLLDNNYLNKE